jgi:hypothetical protein
VAEAEAAPDELSTIANVMTAPPLPFLPPELHGTPIVMGLLCYAGTQEDGERAIAPLRALAEPLADMVRPVPYPEIYEPEPEDFHPIHTGRAIFLDTVDKDAAETILERLQASTAQMSVTQLRVLGGAVARVPADATAFAHRSRRIMANVAAMSADPASQPADAAWVTALAEELSQGDTAGHVGFLGDEGEERVRAAYPDGSWERLAAIKAKYDPDNLFRHNQNILPAAA